MLDVRSGQIVSPAVLVVNGGIIEAVNPAGPTPNFPVIDLGDVTLLPGFIDTHVHMLLRGAASYRPDILGETGADAVLRSTTSARKMLLAGFTTVRDMAQLHLTPDLLAVSMARASDAGWIDAPGFSPQATRSASPAGTSTRDARRTLQFPYSTSAPNSELPTAWTKWSRPSATRSSMARA